MTGIAVSGSDIFVAEGYDNSTVAEYTTTGSLVSGTLIAESTFSYPWDVAVVSVVPEPATWSLVVAGAGLLLIALRRRIKT